MLVCVYYVVSRYTVVSQRIKREALAERDDKAAAESIASSMTAEATGSAEGDGAPKQPGDDDDEGDDGDGGTSRLSSENADTQSSAQRAGPQVSAVQQCARAVITWWDEFPFRSVLALGLGFAGFAAVLCSIEYCWAVRSLVPIFLVGQVGLFLPAVDALCVGATIGPAFRYRVFLALIRESEMTTASVCAVLSAVAIDRPYFASLLLLDLITISAKLQNVTRAVREPFWDIAATFLLMVFVVFIFAAFGLVMFGQLVVIEADPATLNSTTGVIDFPNAMQCPNLLTCFVEVHLCRVHPMIARARLIASACLIAPACYHSFSMSVFAPLTSSTPRSTM